MKILSISELSGAHDSAAALVCDGVLVAAAEEERFNRKKHYGGFPGQAIDFCLDHEGIEISEIDVIAFPARPFRTGRNSAIADANYGFIRRLCEDGAFRKRSLVHKRALDIILRLLPFDFDMGVYAPQRVAFSEFRRRYGHMPEIRYYDHHRSHAAASIFTSGFDSACVLTADGRGGLYSAGTWNATGKRISRLYAEPYTNSLGMFYTHSTMYAGLGQFGEGKFMGLAPYADPAIMSREVGQLLSTDEGRWYKYRRRPSESVLGFPPRTDEDIQQEPYPQFAAACQRALEGAIRKAAEWSLRETGVRSLCLGGGVMLNCSSNGSLRATGVADEFWNFPAAGDAGLTVGAALLCAAEAGELERGRMDTAYLGPEFTASECEAELKAEPDISYSRPADLSGNVARHLAAGNIIGWFQGRMEFGPRALCNRSILADPRTTAMRDRVNRVKTRELWRPLAPVVTVERAADYFELTGESPFMLFAAQVRNDKRSTVPAIVHVDGSARPQTVTRTQNPRIHDLLGKFEALTGVPVLLNTSFNDAGEPIVCTPRDAIRNFLKTGMDMLVLGDFLVQKHA